MSVEVTNETIWDIDAKAFSDLGLSLIHISEPTRP